MLTSSFVTRSLLVAMVPLALLACSDDSSDPGQANGSGFKKYDPCVLVSQAEAEAALGITLKATRHDTDAVNATGQKICYYEDAASSDMKFVQISINEQASMTGSLTAEQLYGSMKSGLTSPTAVTGVGDDAYYGGSGLKLGAGVTTLVKAKGVVINLMVGLGTGNTDDNAHMTMEKDLALKAIARL